MGIKADEICAKSAQVNKKLSYCCDSRSYCVQEYHRLKQLLRDTLSILTLGLTYIHCDRTTTTTIFFNNKLANATMCRILERHRIE